MTITDLASDTWREELDEPTDISVASIVQWYRSHIGDLNNLINNGYIINSSYEIVDSSGTQIDNDAASIFKKLYEIYYLKKQSKSYLGAGGIDSIEVIQQDGIVTRGINRNGVAKSYIELVKDAKEDLKSLLNNYKFNRSTPKQVKTDDYISKFDVVDPES